MEKYLKKYSIKMNVTNEKELDKGPEKEIQPNKDYNSIRRIVLNKDKQKVK
jgi:hypothetical protein